MSPNEGVWGPSSGPSHRVRSPSAQNVTSSGPGVWVQRPHGPRWSVSQLLIPSPWWWGAYVGMATAPMVTGMEGYAGVGHGVHHHHHRHALHLLTTSPHRHEGLTARIRRAGSTHLEDLWSRGPWICSSGGLHLLHICSSQCSSPCASLRHGGGEHTQGWPRPQW